MPFLLIFLMGQSWPLFLFIFVFSTCYNLNSNLNWKKRRWDSNTGGRMEGANESTELRRNPFLLTIIRNWNKVFRVCNILLWSANIWLLGCSIITAINYQVNILHLSFGNFDAHELSRLLVNHKLGNMSNKSNNYQKLRNR